MSQWSLKAHLNWFAGPTRIVQLVSFLFFFCQLAHALLIFEKKVALVLLTFLSVS